MSVSDCLDRFISKGASPPPRAGLQYPKRSLAKRRSDLVIREVAGRLAQVDRTAPRHVRNEAGGKGVIRDVRRHSAS